MASFFLNVATPREGEDGRNALPGRGAGGGKVQSKKRVQEVAAALAGLVKLFSPRTEELLSNIHGSIWHQTAPAAKCLYGVSENVP